MIYKIKSSFILNLILNNLNLKKKLLIINYNKKIFKKIKKNINDY